jgi:hypothetical protein
MTSSSASDHGNPTGIAVLMQKGNTSKEMEANKNFDKWLGLGRRISGPVTVATQSNAWTVFAHLDAGIVGSNPTYGMDVWCVYAFILFVLSCVYIETLQWADHSSKES